ncbi:hypothetical protein FISHEDRAFT_41945 [Fistulina hepatica ATCC 64428]|uniref:Uncharacterized protein n=1 Tax=Fistulina hepatica ATCC 64428 TaxID=1128425 RepID=A0A0D7AE46_9AGAR|nr:hypothetical protein FISHEDRAFT_41945 [Fistulina hepatica ATCC 64428]
MDHESVRPRGRGKPRGGLGKYLRARGRGRGIGRPAEFSNRLVLEEEQDEISDEEEAAERAAELSRKYGKRQLATNADRYEEPKPELDSDEEPVAEAEVELSRFLEKQRISENPVVLANDNDEGEVDHALDHLFSNGKPGVPKKRRVQQIAWDDELDEIQRAKTSADAARGIFSDLKSRFRAKSDHLRTRPIHTAPRKEETDRPVAPPLPASDGSTAVSKSERQNMKDFVDELLD